ncbi:glycerol-3-phosphate acyltransferase [Sporosarcina sp. 179-K 3D1 HS]|uniref:glycerol-3-phosphate acyltransferase n=1 Tax=Sporosarcina sp. 179-K 3D1 HS TaxID=3232169 RepID=UPI0039A2BCB8
MGIWLFGILLWGYAIGCLHGSVVAQKLSGVNLKETGVKNAGASNATIVLGKKFGALVALIDIGKGVVAVLLAGWAIGIADLSAGAGSALLFLAGVAAVLGHVFPFHMGFNGGKGTATLIGILLALDWKMGLIGLLLFIVVTFITDFIVFGVLTLYVVLLFTAYWLGGAWTVGLAMLLFVLAIWKHIENFKRLRNGTENRVSAVFKKKKTT